MSASKLIACILILLLPAALVAGDSATAILRADGKTFVNGASVPLQGSALFVDDLVQTPSASLAEITTVGSKVTVLSGSLVQYKSNAIKLEHGSVTVATSKQMATQVGDLTITPASANWTLFHVTDTDATIHIQAQTGNLTLSDGTTLPQGQETTRDEDSHKGKKKRGAGALPPASGNFLNSPIAIWGGVGAVTGLTIWVLLQGDDPQSPTCPNSANSSLCSK